MTYSPTTLYFTFYDLDRDTLRSPRFLIPSVRCPIIAVMLSATRPARIYLYIYIVYYVYLCFLLVLAIIQPSVPGGCMRWQLCWRFSWQQQQKPRPGSRQAVIKQMAALASWAGDPHTHTHTLYYKYCIQCARERDTESRRGRHTLTQAVGGAVEAWCCAGCCDGCLLEIKLYYYGETFVARILLLPVLLLPRWCRALVSRPYRSRVEPGMENCWHWALFQFYNESGSPWRRTVQNWRFNWTNERGSVAQPSHPLPPSHSPSLSLSLRCWLCRPHQKMVAHAMRSLH